ncbi:hypothetical protein [Streptomyces hoynatensis]|nr:hypothetical protein [Streptomyces hoynatensis]
MKRRLHRFVRRLLPSPRGEYANDGFPRKHPSGTPRRPRRG